MYMVQNYFILCAENINECICVYWYTSCMHFYGTDQLIVQYTLFGGTVPLIRKMQVSRTVWYCQKAKQALCDISTVCAMGRFFWSQVREQRNGKGEVSPALSYTGFKRLCLNFRRNGWKQFWDCLKDEFCHLILVCITPLGCWEPFLLITKPSIKVMIYALSQIAETNAMTSQQCLQ